MVKNKYPQIRLSKGLVQRGNQIYAVFYNPITRRSDRTPTGYEAKQENAKLAKEWRRVYVAGLKKGKHTNNHDPHGRLIRLSEALKLYNDEYVTRYDEPLSHGSKDTAKYVVKRFTNKLGDKPVRDYTSSDFERYVSGQLSSEDPYHKNTIAIDSRTLHAMWQFFIKREIASENPIRRIAAEKKPIRIVPADDLYKLLDELKKTSIVGYYGVKLLYLSGLRKGESLRVYWENIDWKNRLIRFSNTKGHRVDDIPITGDLEELFKEIGIKNFGKVIEYKSVSCYSSYWAAQKKLWNEHRYTIHELRKTYITHLLASGVNILDVQKLSRHTEIKTIIEHYNYLDIDRIRKEVDTKSNFGRPKEEENMSAQNSNLKVSA